MVEYFKILQVKSGCAGMVTKAKNSFDLKIELTGHMMGYQGFLLLPHFLLIVPIVPYYSSHMHALRAYF